MTKPKYKKLIALIFIILILLPIATQTAEAAVPVFETNSKLLGDEKTTALKSIITAIETALTAGNTYAQLAQILLEWAFKLAAESLKRQLLNMIVDQIVTWIQGGGNPKFITDWPGFFRDAIDAAGGNFLKQLGLGLFCSPYNLALRAAFIPIPQFSSRSACTLSQIGVNLDNFLKDFNSGGWVAWQEMVLRPQNNIYGAYLMAWDEYEMEKSAAAKAAESEAQAGRGFLSVKKCIRQHEEIVGEANGQPITKTVCDQNQVVTPGAVVGDLAAKAVGSDIDYIVNAQDFAAYVSAITNAILNRMFAEGVGLLHMALSGSSGGGGGGGGEAARKCDSFLGTPAYNECISAVQGGMDVRQFMKNYLMNLIDTDLRFQNQLFGAKQATLLILNQSLNVLTQLETCQRFPHPDKVKVQSDINTITDQIADIQSDIIALQLKRQQIATVTDLAQIPALFAEVAALVNPATTQSLVFAAQNETSLKQNHLLTYQQQLDSCLTH
ncbi:MAG: hypothetical protein Q7K16_01350 [Candidatus Azambacteria bacterium]|nr:hypothetical protein [Candidatus Azambacteria bacterium]